MMMFLLFAVVIWILLKRKGKPMGWFGFAICVGFLFSPLLLQIWDKVYFIVAGVHAFD